MASNSTSEPMDYDTNDVLYFITNFKFDFINEIIKNKSVTKTDLSHVIIECSNKLQEFVKTHPKFKILLSENVKTLNDLLLNHFEINGFRIGEQDVKSFHLYSCKPINTSNDNKIKEMLGISWDEYQDLLFKPKLSPTEIEILAYYQNHKSFITFTKNVICDFFNMSEVFVLHKKGKFEPDYIYDTNIDIVNFIDGEKNVMSVYYQDFNITKSLEITESLLGSKFWKRPEIVGTRMFMEMDDIIEVARKIRCENFKFDPHSNQVLSGQIYTEPEVDTTEVFIAMHDGQEDFETWLFENMEINEINFSCNRNRDTCINKTTLYIKDEYFKRTGHEISNNRQALKFYNPDLKQNYEIFSKFEFMKSLLCDYQFRDFIFDGARIDLTQYSSSRMFLNTDSSIYIKNKNLNQTYNASNFLIPAFEQKNILNNYSTTSLLEIDSITISQFETNDTFFNSIFKFNSLNKEVTPEKNINFANVTVEEHLPKSWVRNNYIFDPEIEPIENIEINKLVCFMMRGFNCRKMKFEDPINNFIFSRLVSGSGLKSVYELFKKMYRNEKQAIPRLVKIDYKGTIFIPRNYTGFLMNMRTPENSIDETSDETSLKNMDALITEPKIDTSDSWVFDFLALEISELIKFVNTKIIFATPNSTPKEIFMQKFASMGALLQSIHSILNIQGRSFYRTQMHVPYYRKFKSRTDVKVRQFNYDHTRQMHKKLTAPITKNQIVIEDYNIDNRLFAIPKLFSRWAFMTETYVYLHALSALFLKNPHECFPFDGGNMIISSEQENLFILFEFNNNI
ncbi:hypothetical protein [Carp edema virus]|nr:hypothetical protein [Carp edema virus]